MSDICKCYKCYTDYILKEIDKMEPGPRKPVRLEMLKKLNALRTEKLKYVVY